MLAPSATELSWIALGFTSMQTLRTVPLYQFNGDVRRWQAVPSNVSEALTLPESSDGRNNQFTCITYNVFSGILSKSIPHASHRTKHAIETLSRSRCDVLALQEISPAFEQALRRERWLRQDWLLTSLQDYFETTNPTSEGHAEQDGCILAIKRNMIDKDTSASMLRLTGRQGKVLVIVRAREGVSIYCRDKVIILT